MLPLARLEGPAMTFRMYPILLTATAFAGPALAQSAASITNSDQGACATRAAPTTVQEEGVRSAAVVKPVTINEGGVRAAPVTINEEGVRKAPVTINEEGVRACPVTINEEGVRKAPVTINEEGVPKGH